MKRTLLESTLRLILKICLSAEFVPMRRERLLKFTLQHKAVTYCEKHKVLLVVLPNTVIDPRTVMVHLPYAPPAHTEQQRSHGLLPADFLMKLIYENSFSVWKALL